MKIEPKSAKHVALKLDRAMDLPTSDDASAKSVRYETNRWKSQIRDGKPTGYDTKRSMKMYEQPQKSILISTDSKKDNSWLSLRKKVRYSLMETKSQPDLEPEKKGILKTRARFLPYLNTASIKKVPNLNHLKLRERTKSTLPFISKIDCYFCTLSWSCVLLLTGY